MGWAKALDIAKNARSKEEALPKIASTVRKRSEIRLGSLSLRSPNKRDAGGEMAVVGSKPWRPRDACSGRVQARWREQEPTI